MKNYFILLFLLCATVINAQIVTLEEVQELERKHDLPSDIDSLVKIVYNTYGLDDASPDTVLMINDQEYELYLRGILKRDYSVENETTEIYINYSGEVVSKQRNAFSEEGQLLIRDRYVYANGDVLKRKQSVADFDDKGRIVGFKVLNIRAKKESGVELMVAYNENDQIQEIKFINPVSTTTTTLEMVGDTTRYRMIEVDTSAALGVVDEGYVEVVYDDKCSCTRETYTQKDLETGDVEIKSILLKDDKMRVIEREERFGDGFDRYERYTYTPSGELLSITNVLNGRVVKNEFREDGKITIENDTWEKNIYEYDEKGHVIKEIQWFTSGVRDRVGKVTLTKIYYR